MSNATARQHSKHKQYLNSKQQKLYCHSGEDDNMQSELYDTIRWLVALGMC